MRCKNVERRLDAYRTGELPPDEIRHVADHLAACDACSATLQGIAQIAGAMRATPEPSSRRDGFERLEATPRNRGNRGTEEPVWVAFSGRGLRMIHRGSSESEFRGKYARRYARTLEPMRMPPELRRQVVAALAGKGVDRPRLDAGAATDLEARVREVLTQIPRGEVRTYSWLAEQVGKPRAVRAVASYVARNIVPFVVPCHRIVPAAGGTGKYAFGSAMKRELLRAEGVDLDALDRVKLQRRS